LPVELPHARGKPARQQEDGEGGGGQTRLKEEPQAVLREVRATRVSGVVQVVRAPQVTAAGQEQEEQDQDKQPPHQQHCDEDAASACNEDAVQSCVTPAPPFTADKATWSSITTLPLPLAAVAGLSITVLPDCHSDRHSLTSGSGSECAGLADPGTDQRLSPRGKDERLSRDAPPQKARVAKEMSPMMAALMGAKGLRSHRWYSDDNLVRCSELRTHYVQSSRACADFGDSLECGSLCGVDCTGKEANLHSVLCFTLPPPLYVQIPISGTASRRASLLPESPVRIRVQRSLSLDANPSERVLPVGDQNPE